MRSLPGRGNGLQYQHSRPALLIAVNDDGVRHSLSLSYCLPWSIFACRCICRAVVPKQQCSMPAWAAAATLNYNFESALETVVNDNPVKHPLSLTNCLLWSIFDSQRIPQPDWDLLLRPSLALDCDQHCAITSFTVSTLLMLHCYKLMFPYILGAISECCVVLKMFKHYFILYYLCNDIIQI